METDGDDSGWVKLGLRAAELREGTSPCVFCGAVGKPPMAAFSVTLEDGVIAYGVKRLKAAMFPLCGPCADLGETAIIDEIDRRAKRKTVRDLHLSK
jgi:hypothetical protein